MSTTEEPVNTTDESGPVTENQAESELNVAVIEIEVCLPDGSSVTMGPVGTNETLSSVKQSFFEFQETAFVTSCRLSLRETIDKDGYVLPNATDCNEFMELSHYLQPSAKKCVVDVVYEDYDVKKARFHVKRVREAISFPPQQSFATLNSTSNTEDAEAPQESVAQTNEKIQSVLPKFETLVADFDLGAFYQETLLRTGKDSEGTSKALSDVVKSITLSGWNPPPPIRKMQGDLLYVEVATAVEGTFHITATPRGFYVNKSNRNHFDPTPASAGHAHFSHELFSTLLGASNALRAAWYNLTNSPSKAPRSVEAVGALDTVASVYAQGRGDLSSTELQWNTLPSGVFPACNLSTHTYDLARAQDEACSLHGVEELGAPREWNDEIQALRSMTPSDINEKAIKAKMEYKIYTDFTESCKAAVMAIAEGHIAPIAYNEPTAQPQSDIYVYNGVFFSKADDAKDTFRLCEGNDAFKKITSRDQQNLKLIQALGVDGISTVLCTVIDYKGDRYLGQSIIPGIFAQGDNAATLMYGALEKKRPIAVKNSTYKLMEEVKKAYFLPTRNISRKPFAHLADETEAPVVTSETLDTLNRLMGNLEGDEAVTIKLDDVDNIVEPDSETTPHIGPIEGKFLKGSDGRMYALEMMRLTPVDANYVRGERGTQKIPAELLEGTDKNMSSAYVLRQELIALYVQRKIAVQRQEVIQEANELEKKYRKPAAAAASATAAVENKEGEEKKSEEELAAIAAAAAAEALLPEMDEETQQRLANDFAARFAAISVESLGFEVNPNVFLNNFTADVDPAVVAKDEATAKEIASFLYDFMLPMITKQVREGDIIMRDCDSLVSALHKMGVNVRYLGQMARLAKSEEKGDMDLLAQNKQRVQAMPRYWLELLVVEILSRSIKHVLNGLYKESKTIAAAPAQTIATFLTHLFSAIYKKDTTAENAEESKVANSNKSSTAPVATVAEGGSKKSKKKKAVAAAIAAAEQSNCFSACAEGVATQEASLKSLVDTVLARFCFKVSFTEEDKSSEETAAAATPDAAAAPPAPASTSDINLTFLRNRISPATLLRRICQASGLRLVTRSYDYSVGFTAEDVMGLVPKVRSCEPDALLPEFSEMVTTSANVLQQGNFAVAYQIAQEAFSFISQITGLSHKLSAIASDQVTSVLLAAGDFDAALEISMRRLVIAVNLHGLDGSDTLQQHVQLAQLYKDMKVTVPAIQHLLTAKYLQELVGGPRHVELASIYLRLAALYEEVEDLDAALQCLMFARQLNNDMLKGAVYASAIAEFYHRRGAIEQALQMQKQVHDMLKELLPETDERFVDAKAAFDMYQEEYTRMYESAKKEYIKMQVAEAQKQRAIAAAGGKVAAAAVDDASNAVQSMSLSDGADKKKKSSHKKKAKK